jgi:plasmid stabilization system protein ParE
LTLPVRTRPQADADLLEARTWYDAQETGWGAVFFDAVSAMVHRIADMPLAFPLADGQTRRAVLRRFPYSVYFQVRADHILIVAIMHNSRDPRRWRSRD